MIQFVYISQATQAINPNVLKEILSDSVKNNARDNITGMLIFYNGTFLQVLEGIKDDVHSLYAKIRRDERHAAATVLYENKINEQSFANWSMGFVDVQGLTKTGDKDFIDYFSKFDFKSGSLDTIQVQQVKKLIEKFKNGNLRNYIT